MQAACEVLKQIHPTKSTIDENTWYDLDLWSVFQQLNATKSSVGSEYLYYRLRSYDFDEQIISELTQMADDFDANPKNREKAQFYLAKIGKQDKNFVWNYLLHPEQYQFHFSFIYPLLAVLPIVSLLLIINSKQASAVQKMPSSY